MGPDSNPQHYVSFLFAGAEGLIEVRIDNPRTIDLEGEGAFGRACVTDAAGVEHYVNDGWLVMKRVAL